MFRQKIEHVPIDNFFERFSPKTDSLYNDGVSFFKWMHKKILQKQGSKVTEEQVYVHVTCALDTEQMRVVFDSVRDFVSRQRMSASGL